MFHFMFPVLMALPLTMISVGIAVAWIRWLRLKT